MSRIGKKPIAMPAKVEAQIGRELIKVKGPKGELKVDLPDGISVEKKDAVLHVQRRDDSLAAMHGLIRSLLANAVTGVSVGFQRELEIVGIGYRAEAKGKVLSFALGYSHPIEFVLPDGIQVAIDKQTRLSITGIDRQRVGQAAATIRGLRPPDPYKNKGIRYVGEVLIKKQGKAGASGSK
ncbi:MAG: 50S ribosomal protein L6 [Acidobacteria bacterium]|nr:50S ribosomal protein L6 [Acidobacteriota bacterium]